MREEMSVETLSDGWVKISIVIPSALRPFHVTGVEAVRSIRKMAVGMTVGFLIGVGQTDLAERLSNLAVSEGALMDGKSAN
jgi:hypothetical protein